MATKPKQMKYKSYGGHPEEKPIDSPKNKNGKHPFMLPTVDLYRPEYARLFPTLLKAGKTIYEIAQDIGVKPGTIYGWAAKYPELSNALKLGTEEATNRVEMSLYEKATGYKYKEVVKSKKNGGCKND